MSDDLEAFFASCIVTALVIGLIALCVILDQPKKELQQTAPSGVYKMYKVFSTSGKVFEVNGVLLSTGPATPEMIYIEEVVREVRK